jgi:hypothetical protein
MKLTHSHVLLLFSVTMIMLITASSNAFVLGDPCTATLSYPVLPVQYTNSNVPIAVPLSVSCTTNYGSQLYATGSAYDASANVGLGPASTWLTSVNGGTEFNGQLGFNLPPSTQGHSLLISVSIYNTQYGSLLTATSETVQVGTGIQQTTTTTVTVGQSPYYPTSYPSPHQYPTYPFQEAYPYEQNTSQFHHHNYSGQFQQEYQTQTAGNTNLLDFVVIIAILAAVVIATIGLVLAARRQPTWVPVPPPR